MLRDAVRLCLVRFSVAGLVCATCLLMCRYFTKVMSAAAERHCNGRLLFFHEGGYSAFYVPFCGLAVMEELSGFKTDVVDAGLEDTAVGYHDLQPWQDAIIAQVVHGPLRLLQQRAEPKRAEQ